MPFSPPSRGRRPLNLHHRVIPYHESQGGTGVSVCLYNLRTFSQKAILKSLYIGYLAAFQNHAVLYGRIGYPCVVADTTERPDERVLDHDIFAENGRPPNLAVHHLRASRYHHPTHYGAGLIHLSLDSPLDPLIQHHRIGLEEIVLLSRVQPPFLDEVAENLPISTQQILNGIRYLQLAARGGSDPVDGPVNLRREQIHTHNRQV